MELSKNIGKPVLSPAGENLGYVTGALLPRDYSAVAAYVCASEDEEEYYLPVSAIRAASDALIAVRTRQTAPSGLTPCPIGKRAYTVEGENSGVIADFLFGDVAPAFLLYRDGETLPVPVSRFVIGESALVYPSAAPKKPLSVKRKKPAEKPPEMTVEKAVKKSAPLPAPAVEPTPAPTAEPAPEPAPTAPEPLPTPAPAPFVEPAPAPQPISDPAPQSPSREEAPQRERGRFNLLGRQLKRSVFDEQGYLIARAGEKITRETLLNARRHNRLLELTVNTLTNLH